MLQEGQIVLFRFPQTNQQTGKLRPALVLRRLPGRYNDWLICMISSQFHQPIAGLDEIVEQTDPLFRKTGLKRSSVIALVIALVIGQVGRLIPIDCRWIRSWLRD